MNILSFDTSTRSASVALMMDGVLVGEILINDKRTHSQKLMPMLESLMSLADISIDDIDLLAVCVGPGSFTGIRIAVATVKAISHAKNLPIVAINSMENIAFNVMDSSKKIVSILDAQAGNVYCGIYRSVEDNNYSVVEDVDVISLEQLANRLECSSENYIIVGEALDKYREKLNFDNVEFASPDKNVSRSSALCSIAKIKYDKGLDIYDCYTILPKYLRKSQAEMQYDEKQRKAKENDI